MKNNYYIVKIKIYIVKVNSDRELTCLNNEENTGVKTNPS